MSSVEHIMTHRRAAVAFLLSPLTAPVVFWLVTTADVLVVNPVRWASDFALALPFVVLTGAPWAYGATAVFCVPTYIVCIRRRDLQRRHMMVAGVLAGAITMPLALGPTLWTIAVGSLMGGVSAAIFWMSSTGKWSGLPRPRV
jgi:hypothetical protein